MGAAYARYSTWHQDSAPAQVRGFLEDAIRMKIFVRRDMIFFDLAVRGSKNRRQGLDGLRAVLQKKKVQVACSSQPTGSSASSSTPWPSSTRCTADGVFAASS